MKKLIWLILILGTTNAEPNSKINFFIIYLKFQNNFLIATSNEFECPRNDFTLSNMLKFFKILFENNCLTNSDCSDNRLCVFNFFILFKNFNN